MRVLDLFSGLGGWGAAFRDRGHHVTTLDLAPRFHADHVRDLMTVGDLDELGGPFDVILASPPCESFSVMTIGRNWDRSTDPPSPKTEKAGAALALARHTFDLIARGAPRWYVIENPRGMLRKVAPQPPTATTWYCQWGMPYAKPTDLWTNLNGGAAIGWPACRNGGPDHPYTPRGDKENSVQGNIRTREIRRRLLAGDEVPGWRLIESGEPGKCGLLLTVKTGSRSLSAAGAHTAALRALIPYRLSLAVCLACEREGRLPPLDEIEGTYSHDEDGALAKTHPTARNLGTQGFDGPSTAFRCHRCGRPVLIPRRGPIPTYDRECRELRRSLTRARTLARRAGLTDVLRGIEAAIGTFTR